MNTAARMESNGKPGRVHLSEQTASLLGKSGKSHWIEMREDKIIAKGKGELQTYWLRSSGPSTATSSGGEVSDSVWEDATNTSAATPPDVPVSASQLDAKDMRLVTWNVQSLLIPLEQMGAARASESVETDAVADSWEHDDSKTPLQEIVDIVEIVPALKSSNANVDGFQLDPHVETQLEEYCAVIASLYGSQTS